MPAHTPAEKRKNSAKAAVKRNTKRPSGPSKLGDITAAISRLKVKAKRRGKPMTQAQITAATKAMRATVARQNKKR